MLRALQTVTQPRLGRSLVLVLGPIVLPVENNIQAPSCVQVFLDFPW